MPAELIARHKEALHVASIAIYTRPEQFREARLWLNDYPGAEIHAESHTGKLVVVIEAEREQNILRLIDEATDHPSIITAALVYHEILAPEDVTP
ncbi:chaperone NapD [Gilvimarinus agarilyticus]|uniref:chaperone NapD n=1 Tax=Gilvimarinus agarilyticus TaxID=679259 RepID=UPI0005A0CFC2|nr:chaperone NapD [Gilvimarinus agarilyticus]